MGSKVYLDNPTLWAPRYTPSHEYNDHCAFPWSKNAIRSCDDQPAPPGVTQRNNNGRTTSSNDQQPCIYLLFCDWLRESVEKVHPLGIKIGVSLELFV